MGIDLELENAENWQIRDSQYFTADTGSFLLEYAPALEFTSSILAILVDNSEALDTWYSGGWISQRIFLPFEPSFRSSASNRRLRLHEKQILIFPKLTATYTLSVKFPRWFTQVSITVWEYTGPQPDTITTIT